VCPTTRRRRAPAGVDQPSGRRVLAAATWNLAVWVLLTWTLTLEVLVVGAVISVLVGLALSPLGEVVPPSRLVAPRRLIGLLALGLGSLRGIAVANAKLTRMIWSPRIPLRSGMVIVPTLERSDGGLAAVGLISSLVVDNQVVDVDRRRHELQYHAVVVPERDAGTAYETINGPIERLLGRVEGRRR
jgi:multicomponent Na+:H+ antiporter subunit E